MKKMSKSAINALGSLACFAPSGARYRLPAPIDEAWRRDWDRLGADMYRVLERENAKIAEERNLSGERKSE